MSDSTKLIELWNEDKEMLKEKDFRDDAWRLAYNAFMCGFGRGISVKRQEQPEVDLEKEMDKDYDSPLWEGEHVSWMTYTRIARYFAEWGAERQKEQMLKNAVEGEVIKTDKHTSVRYKSFYGTDRYFYGTADKQFKPGDKVRIIVLPIDELLQRQGYEHAERGLVLTIEDMKRIHTFLYAIKNNKQGCFTFTRLSDDQYTEVLRRFNELGKTRNED